MRELSTARMAAVLLLLVGMMAGGQAFAAACQICTPERLCKEFEIPFIGTVTVCSDVIVCKDGICPKVP